MGNVRDLVTAIPTRCVVFDDTILDKHFPHKIELARRQYRGNAYRIVKGIGVVMCVYVNLERKRRLTTVVDG